MNTVTITSHLPASPAGVFAQLVNTRKPFLTENPLIRMRLGSAQTSGVGTIYSWTFPLPFGLCLRFGENVTEWVEPERLAYRALSGWDMEALAVFEPDGEGTKETISLKYRAPAGWSWLMPAWLLRLRTRPALAKIKSSIVRTK